MAISQPNTSGGNTATIIIALLLVAVVVIGAVWMMQDHRSGSERVGDAIEAVPQGLDNAADKLGDQPPAKNVERNLDDAADKVQ